MERVVAGGAASDAYFINTLSMSDGRDMQLRFQWVGVRGRFGWKSDRRQIANRNNRLLGRLHFHTERLQVGRFS